jgi:glycosyltransferase EpsF
MTNPKLKVLTIINSANMGGVEKTLLSCLKKMPRNKIEMTILCYKMGGSLEKEFRQLGVNFHYIKKTGLITLDLIQVLFILFKYRYNVVHSRFGFTSGGFVLASKLIKRKVIVSFHSSTTHRSEFLKYFAYIHLHIHKHITRKLSDKIVGHSKANLNANFREWKTNSKFKIIYNGVDFERLDEDIEESNNLNEFVKKNDFVLLHIGSFRKPKNHLFLLDCFNLLEPQKNNYKLVLVGTGNQLFQEVRNKVTTLGLENFVYFAGLDINIKKYFKIADLFILPSIHEGLANVVIESQYCSVPVCVSDIEPLYESSYKGYHKYFFDPMNLNDATKNISNIITDIRSNNIDSTIDEAKNYVIDNFSIDKMSKELYELYLE